MNVSDARRRSTSSATTRSLSLFSKESPPKTIAPAEGGHDLEGRGRGMPRPYSRPPRLDFRPLRGRQLSLATGVSADSLRRGFGPFLLLGDALGSLGIDVDAGALRRGRLGADDLLDDGGVVLEQLPLLEALLPDRQVDVGAAIGAVLELARLRVVDGLGDVERDGSRLRGRHRAARPEDAAELSYRPHHVGRRHRDIEVVEPLLDLLGEISRADDVGTGVLRLLRL